MFDIKCKRKGCKYNKNLNCSAKNINVKADTECETYQPSNANDINDIEKVAQPPIRKDIKVTCDATCLFNNKHNCSANGITIQTCKNISCPNCCTFTLK